MRELTKEEIIMLARAGKNTTVKNYLLLFYSKKSK